MKNLKWIVVLLIFNTKSLTSQNSTEVKAGNPPLWGPSTTAHARYYYIPDAEVYYDIQSAKFIYWGSGVWIYRSHLPIQYGQFNLYNAYKVVLKDYHGDSPYTLFSEHRKMYAKGYRGKAQKNIGVRHGSGKHRLQLDKPSEQENITEQLNSGGGSNVNSSQESESQRAFEAAR